MAPDRARRTEQPHLSPAERERVIAELGAPDRGPDGERWWVRPLTPRAANTAVELGLRRTRHLHRMVRRLPLEDALVAGAREIRTRPFRPGLDDDEWVALNAAAFAHHPEQGRWTLSDLHDRMSERWFDPDDFLVLDDNTEASSRSMIGWCWMKLHPATAETTPIGEIFVIGVSPGRTGEGLGRALAVRGLVHVWSTHATPTAMLYVEADNLPALALYEDLGFEITYSEAAYER